MKGEERRASRVESKRTVSTEWTRNENYTLQQIRRPTHGSERNRKAEPHSVPRASRDLRGKGTRVILLVRNSEQTLFFATLSVPQASRVRTRAQNKPKVGVRLYTQKVISRATSTITATAGSNGSVSLSLPPTLRPDHYPPQPLLLLVII